MSDVNEIIRGGSDAMNGLLRGGASRRMMPNDVFKPSPLFDYSSDESDDLSASDEYVDDDDFEDSANERQSGAVPSRSRNQRRHARDNEFRTRRQPAGTASQTRRSAMAVRERGRVSADPMLSSREDGGLSPAAAAVAATSGAQSWSDAVGDHGAHQNGSTRRRRRKKRGVVETKYADARRLTSAAAESESTSDVSSRIDDGWFPPDWPLEYLPCSTFGILWLGTLQNMARVSDSTSARDPHKANYTLFNITHENFIGNCRRHGDKEYLACNNEMHRVTFCRERDKSVNPILARFKEQVNGFPFPLCVKANHEGLNNHQVMIPVYDENDCVIGERVDYVCAVLPAANHNISDTVVADFRRKMAHKSTTQFMKLDKEELELEFQVQKVGYNQSLGRIMKDSTFFTIVEEIGEKPEHELFEEANAILEVAHGGESLSKRNFHNMDMWWYENLPPESVHKIYEWIMDEIKAVTKFDSVTFQIFPQYGEGAWLAPQKWALGDIMNSRSLGTLASLIVQDKDNKFDTNTPEFTERFFNASFKFELFYL